MRATQCTAASSAATAISSIQSCRVTEATGTETDPSAAVQHLVDWSTAALDSGLLTRLRMDGSSYECDFPHCSICRAAVHILRCRLSCLLALVCACIRKSMKVAIMLTAWETCTGSMTTLSGLSVRSGTPASRSLLRRCWPLPGCALAAAWRRNTGGPLCPSLHRPCELQVSLPAFK